MCGRGSNEAAVGLAEDVRLHIQVGQEEQEKQEEQEEQEDEEVDVEDVEDVEDEDAAAAAAAAGGRQLQAAQVCTIWTGLLPNVPPQPLPNTIDSRPPAARILSLPSTAAWYITASIGRGRA